MNQRSTLLWGLTFAGLGVAIGAFGAHGLKAILLENQRTETFELAVRYQFYHAFGLIATGLLMNQFEASRLRLAGVFFVLGILLFSGSLYVLALTGETALGMITPLGGLCFLVGWIMLIRGVVKKQRAD